MSWKKILGILCLLIIIAAAYTTLTTTPKKTYNGTYMSFEYPADWKITETDKLEEPDGGQFVQLMSEDESNLINVNVYTDLTLEELISRKEELYNERYQKSIEKGVVCSKEEKTVDGVKCKIYDLVMIRHYCFEKDGKAVLVTCNFNAANVAEDIIKSLKIKQ